MKILQVTPSYKPAHVYGGPTVSVSLLAEELTKDGQDVLVLTTTANGQKELKTKTGVPQQVDGVKVIYFKRWTKDHTHLSPALLSFLWKNVKKYDVVHVHSWWNLVATLSVLICALQGVRPVLSPRGMLSFYSFQNQHSLFKSLLHRFFFKPLLKHTFYHATSESESKDYVLLNKNWQGIIAPNFLPIPLLSTPPHKESKDFKFILLCRIHPIKNIETVFRCLARLSFPFSLSILGSGDPAYIVQLKEYATTLNIVEQITWRGRIVGDQKFKLLQEADLLLLLSFYESFANVVIESLVCGTPVFIAQSVGIADYIKKNDLGWISSHDDNDIINKLEEAYQNQSKRARIRAKAPAMVRKDFSGTNLSSIYNDLYWQVKQLNLSFNDSI